MTVLDNFTFLSSQSSATEGNVLKNIHGESLTLGVTGSFAGSITVQGKQGGDWFDLTAVDLVNFNTHTAITSEGSYAVVSPQGFTDIRCNLTAITEGSVTVTGRLCAG